MENMGISTVVRWTITRWSGRLIDKIGVIAVPNRLYSV